MNQEIRYRSDELDKDALRVTKHIQKATEAMHYYERSLRKYYETTDKPHQADALVNQVSGHLERYASLLAVFHSTTNMISWHKQMILDTQGTIGLLAAFEGTDCAWCGERLSIRFGNPMCTSCHLIHRCDCGRFSRRVLGNNIVCETCVVPEPDLPDIWMASRDRGDQDGEYVLLRQTSG
jgi:hypothetical protein